VGWPEEAAGKIVLRIYGEEEVGVSGDSIFCTIKVQENIMKPQRFVVVLLVVNLVLLALLFARQRASAAQDVEPILRARILELVDARGRVRSRLNVESSGEVVFRLFDQTGTIRVKLGAGEAGSGLVLIDETTEPGVHIVARRAPVAERKTTSITLTGAGQQQRVITPER
jgi:hypothetical protein